MVSNHCLIFSSVKFYDFSPWFSPVWTGIIHLESFLLTAQIFPFCEYAPIFKISWWARVCRGFSSATWSIYPLHGGVNWSIVAGGVVCGPAAVARLGAYYQCTNLDPTPDLTESVCNLTRFCVIQWHTKFEKYWTTEISSLCMCLHTWLSPVFPL